MATGLRDVPIEKIDDETLGVRPYVDSLAQFIMECDTPMTIAIQGDWGSGKTSMMNLIKAGIEQRYPGKIRAVWFNTWQYSQFNAQDQLGISLLSRFAAEVSGQSDTGDRVRKMLGTVAKSVARNMAFVGTMALTGSAEGAKDAQEAVDGVFSKDFVRSLTELKDSLVKITAELLERDNKDRVVVFIDDLDRLVPERAVDLLEVFKLFLDVPGCVFVLACDYQVIAHGLQKKFGAGESDMKGKSFFDKIIQLPFSMPVSQYDTRRYTGDLLARIGITPSDEDVERYRRLIGAAVGLNPRSMKRLFNAFQLNNLAAEKKGLLTDTGAAQRAERQRILLACLCMQTAFEPAYRYLAGLGDALSGPHLEQMREIEPANPREFKSLLKDMGGADGAMWQRFPGFMGAFIDAIQLASDDRESLSDSELHNLREILSFASITATSAPLGQVDDSDQDSRLLRDMLRRLASEINEEFCEELETLRDVLRVNGTSRKGKAYGNLTTTSGLLVDKKRVIVTCYYSDRADTQAIGVHLSARQFDWLCGVVEREIGAEAPYQEQDKIYRDGQQYHIDYHAFAGNETLDEKFELFETMTRDCLRLVIPRLSVRRNRK